MRNTMNALIIRTALWTLGVAFVVFSYGTSLLGFVAPSFMADLCDDLGARTASAMYYERVYQNNKTNQNLYMVLDRFTQTNNSNKIVKYIELFFDLDENEWKGIINKVDAYSETFADTTEKYAFGCDEYGRLKCSYIDALLKLGRVSDAVTAFEECTATINLEKPFYGFFVFVSHGAEREVNDLFSNGLDGYFDRFSDAFELLKDRTEPNSIERIRPSYFKDAVTNYFGDNY